MKPACPNRSDQSQVPRALGSPIVQIGPTLERFGCKPLTTNNSAAHLGDDVRQTNRIPARNDYVNKLYYELICKGFGESHQNSHLESVATFADTPSTENVTVNNM
jgi:hypothetical protein